jgi:NADPH-dependent glutamate synthase beta subunit-like oxidoreductase
MENEILIGKDDLVPAVQKMLAEKARFGTATCLDEGDKFEIIYHFEPQDKPEPLKHIRVTIAKGDVLPSISGIYLCATLIENELKDLFKIQISSSAFDFQNKFIRTQESPEFELIKSAGYALQPPTRILSRCQAACPAGIDIPRYVRLIGEGRYDDSLAVIKQAMPFPGILGRVCFAPCEDKCRQGKQSEPIANRMLKRFAFDHATYQDVKPVKRTGKRVAIIGSGPAGLTAAYYLAKMGHAITIYEALPQVGGMMRVGIPAYRLPRKILDDEVDIVKNLNVEIKTNTTVQSLEDLFNDGYQAILVATGAHQGMKLGIIGEDHPKVMECIDLLKDVSLGKPINLGNRVAVIGGGNAAIDAARTARRLGAKEVTIFYRRTRAEMPANHTEVEEALNEGMKIEFLVAPRKVLNKDGAVALENIRMKLAAPDASGRPRPEPIPGSEFITELDSIVAAVGQIPPIQEQFGLKIGKGNIIETNTDTLTTSKTGVFAAGDVTLGPASVVEAVAQGKKAAISIDKYLGGEGILWIKEIKIKELTSRNTFLKRLAEEHKRVLMPMLAIQDRLPGFDEVELGLTEEMAIAEGKRCWRCDLEE